jgi:ribosome recycling factor
MQILIRNSKWNSLIQRSRPFLRVVPTESGVISAWGETLFQKSSFSTTDKMVVHTDIDLNGTRSNSLVMQRRYFGRKAGKMGKHLQNLDELAHRQAKEKNQQNRLSPDSETPSLEEITVTETDDDQSIVSLPLISDVKARMMKVVIATEESFKAIRGSEPSPELFDSVQVKAYGALAPLNSIGQVVINSPTLATISCFDPDNAPSVRDAIRDMQGMNFNPRIEEGTVVVPIPRVSAETRKATVKQLGKVAENTKQRIRRIRRDYLDVVKKVKDGKVEGISEDDAFRTGKEIDAVTEECIKVLNDVVQKKQDSIMSV